MHPAVSRITTQLTNSDQLCKTQVPGQNLQRPPRQETSCLAAGGRMNLGELTLGLAESPARCPPGRHSRRGSSGYLAGSKMLPHCSGSGHATACPSCPCWHPCPMYPAAYMDQRHPRKTVDWLFRKSREYGMCRLIVQSLAPRLHAPGALAGIHASHVLLHH